MMWENERYEKLLLASIRFPGGLGRSFASRHRVQPRRFGPEAINRLTQYVDRHPDATLERIHEQVGVNCTLVTIHHTLRRLGYRFKKNAAGQRTRSR